MLQLVYVSTARAAVDVSGRSDVETPVPNILRVSRSNNRRDAITGLLHFNGKRFLQALEGEPALVEAAFERIRQDPRHFAVVILSRREVATREFGEWAMAHQERSIDHDAFVARVANLVRNASPSVRGTFEGFVGLKAA